MPKRIVVIGATGIIGTEVARALEAKGYEVVGASRNGAVRVDMYDRASLDALFALVHDIDAVVCVAASGQLTPLEILTDEEVEEGLKGKLLGQVALLLRAVRHLRDGGSITLTSGTFKEPTVGSAVGGIVNTGLEAFVKNVTMEMPRGIRANVVSPGWVKETLEKLGMDSSSGTPVCDVARAYVEAVEGQMRGQTLFPNQPVDQVSPGY
jgi:NAD(P)-dependent dehydrogenase (short-subunit alcohol dehydrogenase family)